MRFVPVYLCLPKVTIFQPDCGRPLQLAPPARTKLPPNTHDIPNAAADGYDFDVFDSTDNFEVHDLSLLRETIVPELRSSHNI